MQIKNPEAQIPLLALRLYYALAFLACEECFRLVNTMFQIDQVWIKKTWVGHANNKNLTRFATCKLFSSSFIYTLLELVVVVVVVVTLLKELKLCLEKTKPCI